MKTMILSILFISHVYAEMSSWQKKFNSYIEGLPKDVASLFERMESCNHWGGEEPYDEARKKEIIAAVEKLKCNDLDADKNKMTDKYKKQNHVVKKIEDFPEFLKQSLYNN